MRKAAISLGVRSVIGHGVLYAARYFLLNIPVTTTLSPPGTTDNVPTYTPPSCSTCRVPPSLAITTPLLSRKYI